VVAVKYVAVKPVRLQRPLAVDGPATKILERSMIQASQSKSLYIQVVLAIVVASPLVILSGIGELMNPLAIGFVKLVRMIIPPIIFITVVVGIGRLNNAAEVGRIGVKAIVYFEVLTTLAMLIGLIVGHVIQPGVGMNVNPATLDAHSVRSTPALGAPVVVDFLLAIIPDSVVGAFARETSCRCCSSPSCSASRWASSASAAGLSCRCWKRPAPRCSASSA